MNKSLKSISLFLLFIIFFEFYGYLDVNAEVESSNLQQSTIQQETTIQEVESIDLQQSTSQQETTNQSDNKISKYNMSSSNSKKLNSNTETITNAVSSSDTYLKALGQIEAEQYFSMSGVATENCSDTGYGLDVGGDVNKLRFNQGTKTGYDDALDIIYIKGDILPLDGANHPNSIMSIRAALAHELYGHAAYRGTSLGIGAWNDEFRASYMAAKNAPNLSQLDKYYLIQDAIIRAQEANIPINYNDLMKSILYGY